MAAEALPMTAAGYGWGSSFTAKDSVDSKYTFPLNTPKPSQFLTSVRDESREWPLNQLGSESTEAKILLDAADSFSYLLDMSYRVNWSPAAPMCNTCTCTCHAQGYGLPQKPKLSRFSDISGLQV